MLLQLIGPTFLKDLSTLLHADRYLIQITFYFLPPLTTLFPELPIVILFNYPAQARVSYQHPATAFLKTWHQGSWGFYSVLEQVWSGYPAEHVYIEKTVKEVKSGAGYLECLGSVAQLWMCSGMSFYYQPSNWSLPIKWFIFWHWEVILLLIV